MEIVAYSTFVRQSPRKLRLIADMIRGLPVVEAQAALENLSKRGARSILAVLKQGIGNAVNNFKLNKDGLIIKTLEISGGSTMKRARFVSRGRVHRILKRTSHITMRLEAPGVSIVPQAGKATNKGKEADHGTKS